MIHAKSAKLFLLIASSVMSLVLLEAAVRLVFGVPLLTVRDLRELKTTGDQARQTAAIYDPLLGWTLRPGIAAEGFNTIEYGIRKNSKNTETVSEGGILAVGDSFTAGSEVEDEASWPAHLERMLGRRVFNGSSGGFGADQVVLRIEQLLPILKPKVVLLGVLVPDDVQRTGYSVYGRPKPYFVREAGRFVHKNNPVPTSEDTLSNGPIGKRVMSRFMTLNIVFERLRPDWWFSEINGQRYQRVPNVPTAVTCYMIGRLQAALSAAAIRGVVVLQHGGWTFARRQPRSNEADVVIRCATEAGYEVVDEYDGLAATASRSIDELKLHYVMHDQGSTYGHMSSDGNENVARLIAERLRQPAPPPRPPGETARAAPEPGDGINRLAGVDGSHLQRANATVTTSRVAGPIKNEPVQQIAATQIQAEHYVAIGWSAERPGPYTFSTYVRERDKAGVRVQLLDSKTNGAIADFTFVSGLFDLIKVGQASDLDFASEPAGEGWVRLSLTARLPAPAGSVIVQLTSAGKTNFAGSPAEPLVLQAPMVEQGQVTSRFCRPENCAAPDRARVEMPPVKREPGDGINRLIGVEVSQLQPANTTIGMVTGAGPLKTEPLLQIAATKERGEHYVAVGWSAERPGPYSFSVYVRERDQGGVRLQLLDSKVNGVIADFTFAGRMSDVFTVGHASDPGFLVEPVGEGWVRLSLSATLLEHAGSVIFQLTQGRANTGFAGDSTGQLIQAPMVELGQTPSRFCRPGTCSTPTKP